MRIFYYGILQGFRILNRISLGFNKIWRLYLLQKIGEDWIVDLSRLRDLERFASDVRFTQDFIKAKQVSDK
jgi:hypothetical protein